MRYCATCSDFKSCPLDERLKGRGCVSWNPENDASVINQNLGRWIRTLPKIKKVPKYRISRIANTWGVIPSKFPIKIHRDFMEIDLDKPQEVLAFHKKYKKYTSKQELLNSLPDQKKINTLIYRYFDCNKKFQIKAIKKINLLLEKISPVIEVNYLKQTDDMKNGMEKDRVVLGNLRKPKNLFEWCLMSLALEVVKNPLTCPCLVCDWSFIKTRRDQITCSVKCSRQQVEIDRRDKRQTQNERTLTKNSIHDVRNFSS